jgi:hypothetical protein
MAELLHKAEFATRQGHAWTAAGWLTDAAPVRRAGFVLLGASKEANV